MSPRLSLITVFGLGHLRPAPGTWGSLPPVAAAALMLAAGLGPDSVGGAARWPWPEWAVFHAVLVVLCGAGVLACVAQGDRAEARFHRKDPSEAVADETAGQCIALLFMPAAALATPALTAFTLVFSFLAFRAFDIFKPWPARQVQRVPGAWGIVLDDLVAGVYALALVQLAARLAL